MKKTVRWLPAIALLGFPIICFGQTATITFYSYTPSAWKEVKTGLIPPGSRASFVGWLFDGDKRTIHSARGRFVTFRLPVGGHDFAATYKSKPKKPDLHLDLEPGHHYCVRLSQIILSPTVLVGFVDTKVEEIPCRDAAEEARRSQPLDPKRIEPTLLGDVETSATFPREP